MNKLFGDLKTDEEKSNFFLSGRGYETGVIAAAIQTDVAMAYHRCAEYKKELAALQAECALMREQLDAMAEYKVAAHQLIGIPASVGISEPIEGFAKRPQDIMPAVRDMALRIELLEHQAAERDRLLAESRANDQQAMAYLNEVRAIVGGDDFPDMVRRCDQLRKDAERYRSLLEAVLREMPHGEGRRGNAPGHGHSVPGVWDEDNRALAGKECAWCKVWREALAAMQEAQP